MGIYDFLNRTIDVEAAYQDMREAQRLASELEKQRHELAREARLIARQSEDEYSKARNRLHY